MTTDANTPAPATANGEQSAEDTQQGNSAPQATQDQNTAPSPESGSSHMVPKSRLDSEIQKRKATEKQLEELAAQMLEDVPDQFKGIVPEGLSAADRIAWMRKATAAGFFSGPSTSPDPARPTGKPATDLENMDPQAMRAMGYKNTQ